MKLAIAWLSYLTADNYDRRHERHRASLISFAKVAQDPCVVPVLVDNSEPGNVSLMRLRDELCPEVPIFKAGNKFYDVAVHYAALRCAKNIGSDYFAYTYDDFEFYDITFAQDAVAFMEDHGHVSCTRITQYDFGAQHLFDTARTPKEINPESVCHTNTPRGSVVNHSGPFTYGSHRFYESDWNPISRPTIWRASVFESLVGYPESCPIMQPFERHMYGAAAKSPKWCSGFMDIGSCNTSAQRTSERIASGVGGNTPIEVPIRELDQMMSESRCWR